MFRSVHERHATHHTSPDSTDKTSTSHPEYVQLRTLDRTLSRMIDRTCDLQRRHSLSSKWNTQTPSLRVDFVTYRARRDDAGRSPLSRRHSYCPIRAAFMILSPRICSRKRSGGTAGEPIRTSCHPSLSAPLCPFIPVTHWSMLS